jgi:deoxyribose-phosphate aldolase
VSSPTSHPSLERLVKVIVEEVRAAQSSGVTPASLPSGSLAAIIDHTLLAPQASRHEIERLCHEASEYGFATVCVNPTWVSMCAERLRGSRVRVCSVVGFPLGATTADVKQFETRRALADGAREIDMVMNIGALKSGDVSLVARDIDAVASICHAGGAITKVIIEAALLTDEEKIAACVLAQQAGADFVKTSTGFGPGGATVHDVALMRRAVGSQKGVKAAGGIRDVDSARALVAAGATRIGTSAGVHIVQQHSGGSPSSASTTY